MSSQTLPSSRHESVQDWRLLASFHCILFPGFPVRSGHHHCGKLRADTTDVEDLICVGEHVRRTSSDVRPKLGSSLRKPAPMRSLKVDEHLLLVLRVQDVDVEG